MKKLFRLLKIQRPRPEEDAGEVREAVHFYFMLLKMKKRRESFNVDRVLKEVYTNVDIISIKKSMDSDMGEV